MASGKEYLTFILGQLSPLPGITYRAMMGEYILYLNGRIFGGIYDDRLLIKPVPAALRMMPGAPLVSPYEGAKEMLLAANTDSDFLCGLLTAMYEELPKPKKK